MTEQEQEVQQPRALDALQQAKPKRRFGWRTFLILGLAILGSLNFIGGMLSGGGKDRSQSHAAAWTPPEGFTLHLTDPWKQVAYQWETPTRAECSRGRSCFALNVVAENGCPRGLYAEIKLLNAAGANIGWTNDTAQGVEPNERVRLVFRTSEPGTKSAHVTEINCR
jgi:hypothetical protein